MLAVIAAGLGFLWMGSHAFSCDCPFPKGIQTDADRVAYRLGTAVAVAAVRVTEVRLRANTARDPEAIGNATIVKWIKGTGASKLKLVSLGANEGGNCGLASVLFSAASEQRLLSVELHEDPARKGSFWIHSCGYFKLDEFGSASEGR